MTQRTDPTAGSTAGSTAGTTATEVRVTASCSSCGSPKVTRLSMVLTDGTPVDFTSCHACEHKTWAADGVELDRETVLAKTQKHKP